MKNIKYLIPIVFALAFFSCASSPKKLNGSNNEISEDISELENTVEDSTDNFGDEIDEVTETGGTEEEEDFAEGDATIEYKDVDSENQNEYAYLDEGEAALETEAEEEPLIIEERVFPDELPALPELLNSDSDDENDNNNNEFDFDEESESTELENVDGELIEERDYESLEDSELDEQHQSDIAAPIVETTLFETDETPAADNSINEDAKMTETDYTAEDTNDLDETKTDDADNKMHFATLPQASRSMVVKKGQAIEVVYPGRGWIYQENIDGDGNIDTRNRNFIFGGRKLGVENQVFTMRSRVPGKYFLHFYKNDALTEEYIDDYLEVFVEDEVASSSKPVVAPDYAATVPQKPVINAENANEIRANKKIRATEIQEEQKASKSKGSAESMKDNSVSKNYLSDSSETQNPEAESKRTERNSYNPALSEEFVDKTIVQTTNGMYALENESVDVGEEKEINDDLNGVIDIAFDDEPIVEMSQRKEDDEDSKTILEQAKKWYEEKKYGAALDAIRRFLDVAVLRIDEALYLQGQILEAKSEFQNIRGAIDSYDKIVKNYPASKLWEAANKRSIYLKRFYIDIR